MLTTMVWQYVVILAIMSSYVQLRQKMCIYYPTYNEYGPVQQCFCTPECPRELYLMFAIDNMTIMIVSILFAPLTIVSWVI